MADPIAIETIEMHTGGEPVRLVVGGYPAIPGATILAKRRYAREQLDHLRRLLIFEPRGHFDMYGVIPVQPDIAGADLAVLFMHNEGYSTMCGHAVIALGRWAVESGRVKRAVSGETPVNIQCPCGLVRAWVASDGAVRFESVPAFAFAIDAEIELAGFGPVKLDVGYGGAFYAVLPAERVGLSLPGSSVRELVDTAARITAATKAQIPLRHPDDADLAFLYGTIFTDGGDGADAPSLNVFVFAEREVDRSPTGSGVTARMALQVKRGIAKLGGRRRFQSLTGAVFTGRAVAPIQAGEFAAVRVEVGGRAHYSGSARFTLEPDDRIGQGFLLG
jgi:proline racemase